jgi:hypothetical protein
MQPVVCETVILWCPGLVAAILILQMQEGLGRMHGSLAFKCEAAIEIIRRGCLGQPGVGGRLCALVVWFDLASKRY